MSLNFCNNIRVFQLLTFLYIASIFPALKADVIALVQ